MKALNFIVGIFVVMAALIAPPALLGSVVAGSAGLMLMASAGYPAAIVQAAPAPLTVSRAPVVPATREFTLDKGGKVVFRVVGGKLTSRFYKA